MKTRFLFPNSFKTLGWVLFVPSLLLIISSSIFNTSPDDFLTVDVFAIYQESIGEKPGFFDIITNSISDELLTIGMILGGIFIGFSKLKEEDEMISKIRYESLVWATYFNYALILFFTLFIYGMPYLNVLFYNMFTLLIFFIIRFHYTIYKLNKTNQDD
ncbi:hypothetical protein [uncultured Flavobacterium sp.]|uniref:hypothetical protein n=1 Tax=uncultured Flavobacterium sp. TaxID=165435 RepID=UPI0030EF4552|tara:strand:+ start:326265 stop:326741 length:477 start_codon:yes stop_codon:yes gene_type:complete